MSMSCVGFTPRVRGLKIPEDMLCPISGDIMVDPVKVDADPSVGKRNVYDRANIQGWFDRGKRLDPLTLKPLRSTNLEADKDMNADIVAQLDEFEEKLHRCRLAAQAGTKFGGETGPKSVPMEYLCTWTRAVACFQLFSTVSFWSIWSLNLSALYCSYCNCFRGNAVSGM